MQSENRPSGVNFAVADRLSGGGFYGWFMVAVASLCIFASGPGQSHTFGAFNKLIAADLGLGLTEVASAYGIATTAAAFLLPVFGRLIEKYGPRKSLFTVCILLGFACLLFGAVANMLWLVVGFGLLRFLGQGSLMLGGSNLVAQWFSAKRGFAMGLMMVGFAASIAFHPMLGRILIEWVGWREAWVILGFMTWIMMLPVLWFAVIDRPELIGQRPDGEVVDDMTAAPSALAGATLEEALRHSSFYLVSGGFFMISALVTTLHFHQFNIFEAQGLDPDDATNAYLITALAMMAFMPIIGRGFDRFRTRYMFAAGLCVQASALVAVTFVTSVPTFMAYAVLFGLNNTFSMTMAGYLWPRYFGRKQLGRIQGTGQMVLVIGASLGPIPVSLAFDFIGDATTTLRVLALLPLAAAIAVVALLRTMEQVPGEEHLE
ncbi:MAG: MFS transporter [Paracoccaceae bacterium]